MLSRTALKQQASASRAIRQQCQRRGLAAPASGSFAYETGDAKGIKFASRDMAGPTTQLALVAKAGTRFETLPGLTLGLRNFAFKGTQKRSALRIQRESELLGAELYTAHSRENLVIGAKFLRDDLPYFVELLAEVATQTKYAPHIFHEDVETLIHLSQKKFLGDVTDMATNSAHGLAFHRGLGVPLSPPSSVPITKYLDAETIDDFSHSAYSTSNFAIVANGVKSGELSKWAGEFFSSAPTSSAAALQSPQTKYYGGEERIAHAGGNAMVIAFPGSSSTTGKFYKPEIAVLASLLGGESNVKWTPGFSLLAKAAAQFPGATISTKSSIYSDAGLLAVTVKGSAKDVKAASAVVVKTIQQIAQGVSSEDFQKAKATAKFRELEHGQNIYAGIELTGAGLVHGNKPYQIDETAKAVDAVTEEQVKAAAKSILESKASVSAVGDLYVLPYAEDLGLKV